jgi:hypothetical protein
LKELTDQGRLQYDYPLGLCLVAAGRGNTIPLKEVFDQPDIRLGKLMYGQRHFWPPPNSSCCAVIRFALLMEQDLLSPPLNRSPQSKHR